MSDAAVVVIVVLGVGVVLLVGVLALVFVHLRRFSRVRSAVQARLLDELGTLKARRAAVTVAFEERKAPKALGTGPGVRR